MIRYTLKCENDHSFESWFASAEAFETLVAKGLTRCVACGTARVEKALMAPALGAPKRRADANLPAPNRAPVSLATPSTEVEKAIAALRAKVEAHSDYVGPRFADEARKMHLGDAPARTIHGEANATEARALIEDGVPIVPLPFGPKQKAN